MRTSQRGVDLIREFEGFFANAYYCPAGVLTIGYGHTDAAGPPKVSVGMTVTKKEAEDILRSDLRSVEKHVSDLVESPLNQNQFDALVSFAFNVGCGALARSTALKRLNAGDYDGCAEALLMWNKGGGRVLNGLVRRRKAERLLFLSKSTDATIPPDIPKPEPKPAPEHWLIKLLKFLFWKRG